MPEPMVLVLEDGFTVLGDRGGQATQATGEVVINTCMTGYQEVLSDPSYAGQMVVMTYPLIGNYGATPDFQESGRPWVRALITRQLSTFQQHWRSHQSLADWLDGYGVPIMTGCDTRRLARHLRGTGAQRAIIGPAHELPTLRERVQRVTRLEEQDLVRQVSEGFSDLVETLDPALLPPSPASGGGQGGGMRQWSGLKIVVVDYGVKRNILRSLRSRGVEVEVVPYDSDLDTVLARRPDAVVLSNGPGDPAQLQSAVAMTRQLIRRVPVLGICLGHQLIGQAAGARTSRLRFGHHGGNHPVLDLRTGRVTMTSQNHEFEVDADSLPAKSGFRVSHRNLHDGSVEGLVHDHLPVRSVQFHPEGGAGPQDNQVIFDEFLDLVRGVQPAPITVREPVRRPSSVLVIGSGPIVIGQAAEFDYAGTQACKALREEGVRTILVNSNPATIMTDEGIADRVYIEPLTVEAITAIIERERPDGLLPTLGGQTGLNLAVALADAGVLERCQVRVLGTPLASIREAEDREAFKAVLVRIGEPVPDSATVTAIEDARDFAASIGFPLVVRPAYTLGGTGGGMAGSPLELEAVVRDGLAASPIRQVLVERSLAGWKEIEYEVMRDANDTCIAVCNMENIDPMGVHTGDSIVVAPSQTLSDRQYQMLRSAALRIIRALRIEGGCNVQFALDPESDQYYVIEVNPRVSRSSALASKATGYPIARVAAKIAAGRGLHEIANAVTGQTSAAFEPALDYCVVKIPRWPFDKFPAADRTLGTQMKSTGEVMAIERTFEAALSKALRALEQRLPDASQLRGRPDLLHQPNDRRLMAALQALRDGATNDEVITATGYAPWFVDRLAYITALEAELQQIPSSDLLRRAKRAGFDDGRIAELSSGRLPAMPMEPTFRQVDTCAAEFEAVTPYYYATYEDEDEIIRSGNQAVAVIGSGPIRIGQGIEFDYCSVHASAAIREAGYDSVLINSNPETVSTDFDASTRLYFEPLDLEGVRNVLRRDPVLGVMVQFGGQTGLNLADALAAGGVRILGSTVETIDLAEDRRRCEALLRDAGIPQSPGGSATNVEEALGIAVRVGYPVLVRPSYVLGGRGMEIVHSPADLRRYVEAAIAFGLRGPILVDKYLLGRELDVDAVCDAHTVLIPGILEHIERAGIHSGDSFAVYPPITLTPAETERVAEATTTIAHLFKAVGLINIQFVIQDGVPYVLEVNPRASRTVPFLSKVTGVPMVTLSTHASLGRPLSDFGFGSGLQPSRALYAVKAPVFSMAKLPAVDAVLGPEMKSTGEAMGIAKDLPTAQYKAFLSTMQELPPDGAALCSIADADKEEALPILRAIHALGLRLFATAGTAALLRDSAIPATTVQKLRDGHPNVVDVIHSGQVHLVVNTVSASAPIADNGAGVPLRDGYEIRRASVERRIPCLTSLDTARALVQALSASRREHRSSVATLGEYVGAPTPEVVRA
ncbi:MAG: carbamoyl-phosphate synthase large subunit [Chloroflexota bacterium]|jgi:carbamoyl-phosphate synthase large subunit|nr:carbamoyl-phosphate synthase large subunit [Chloroflexota bacterium]